VLDSAGNRQAQPVAHRVSHNLRIRRKGELANEVERFRSYRTKVVLVPALACLAQIDGVQQVRARSGRTAADRLRDRDGFFRRFVEQEVPNGYVRLPGEVLQLSQRGLQVSRFPFWELFETGGQIFKAESRAPARPA